MSKTLNYIKVKNENGVLSDPIPIGVAASQITIENNQTLETVLNNKKDASEANLEHELLKNYTLSLINPYEAIGVQQGNIQNLYCENLYAYFTNERNVYAIKNGFSTHVKNVLQPIQNLYVDSNEDVYLISKQWTNTADNNKITNSIYKMTKSAINDDSEYLQLDTVNKLATTSVCYPCFKTAFAVIEQPSNNQQQLVFYNIATGARSEVTNSLGNDVKIYFDRDIPQCFYAIVTNTSNQNKVLYFKDSITPLTRSFSLENRLTKTGVLTAYYKHYYLELLPDFTCRLYNLQYGNSYNLTIDKTNFPNGTIATAVGISEINTANPYGTLMSLYIGTSNGGLQKNVVELEALDETAQQNHIKQEYLYFDPLQKTIKNIAFDIDKAEENIILQLSRDGENATILRWLSENVKKVGASEFVKIKDNLDTAQKNIEDLIDRKDEVDDKIFILDTKMDSIKNKLIENDNLSLVKESGYKNYYVLEEMDTTTNPFVNVNPNIPEGPMSVIKNGNAFELNLGRFSLSGTQNPIAIPLSSFLYTYGDAVRISGDVTFSGRSIFGLVKSSFQTIEQFTQGNYRLSDYYISFGLPDNSGVVKVNGISLGVTPSGAFHMEMILNKNTLKGVLKLSSGIECVYNQEFDIDENVYGFSYFNWTAQSSVKISNLSIKRGKEHFYSLDYIGGGWDIPENALSITDYLSYQKQNGEFDKLSTPFTLDGENGMETLKVTDGRVDVLRYFNQTTNTNDRVASFEYDKIKLRKPVEITAPTFINSSLNMKKNDIYKVNLLDVNTVEGEVLKAEKNTYIKDGEIFLNRISDDEALVEEPSNYRLTISCQGSDGHSNITTESILSIVAKQGFEIKQKRGEMKPAAFSIYNHDTEEGSTEAVVKIRGGAHGHVVIGPRDISLIGDVIFLDCATNCEELLPDITREEVDYLNSNSLQNIIIDLKRQIEKLNNSHSYENGTLKIKVD